MAERPILPQVERAKKSSVSFLAGGLFGSLLLIAACTDPKDIAHGEEATRPIIPLLEEGRRTTDPSLAVSNLHAMIVGLDTSSSLEVVSSSAGLHYDLLSLRTQFLGRYSDFSQMDDLTRLRKTNPDAAERIQRARFLSAVHDFSSAVQELDLAETAGAKVSDLRQILRLAMYQELSVGLAEAEQRAEQSGSMHDLVQLAVFQAAVGRFDDADHSFIQAAAAYRDVSPFPLAFIAFQRGLMWSESAGHNELGEAYYQEALRILPTYVVANVHLAELVLDSNPEEARHHYEVAAGSEDPEPLGKLATYYARSSPDLAAQYRERAEKGYDQLLDQYPLAFADHAAEFFAGAGNDPERAVLLATQNLSNRRNPRAYLVALRAAEANADFSLLCSLCREAKRFEASHPVLAAELDRITPVCALRPL